LTNERVWIDEPAAATYTRWVGGVGLGSHILYQEGRPDVGWDHPENRVILGSGPLAGSRLSGSGLLAAVTRGPMTGGACSTQANGFYGAYLKTQGYDAVVIQGQSSKLVYVYVHGGGKAEIRSAEHLRGLDTWELGATLKAELRLKTASVFGIGPAGEHRVRFAALAGDNGHVAGHNGLGAVLGAKQLKAIVVARGTKPTPVHDREALERARKALVEHAKTRDFGMRLQKYGTAAAISQHYRAGSLPIKNLLTNTFPGYESLTGERIRTTAALKLKPEPCWACNMKHHCSTVTVMGGPYAGFEGEEPEYEGMTGMGSTLGVTDTVATVVLANLIDRMGMDINESAWTLGFAIECYLEGILSPADVDGLDLGWGKPEGIRQLIERIARRQGIGDILADGVKEAARRIGGRAVDMAVFTEKGNSPRGHDHRAVWSEMLDTCVSNTGTIEATGGQMDFSLLGLPPRKNLFDAIETALYNAKMNGFRQFQDSLGCCRFCVDNPPLMVDALNAITGWSWSFDDAMTMGRRVVHQLRAFNFRCGITADVERPSPRYGSVPADGPAKGSHFTADWPRVLAAYYDNMGWDPATGKPLPDTLRALRQEELIQVFWPAGGEPPPGVTAGASSRHA